MNIKAIRVYGQVRSRFRTLELTLIHSDVAPCFEHHHCHWTAGKPISNNQLGDNVQPNLLIGDRLNHSNGDDVEERNDEGEDEPLDGEFGLPDLDRDNTESKHGHWFKVVRICTVRRKEE